MKEILVGEVVITGSGQAGTYIGIESGQACVLLANGCFWYGNPREMRLPQSSEDLAAAPLEVDRFEGR